MRKILINCIAFGIIGFLLGENDVKYISPSFWLITFCCVVIQVNSGISKD